MNHQQTSVMYWKVWHPSTVSTTEVLAWEDGRKKMAVAPKRRTSSALARAASMDGRRPDVVHHPPMF